MNEPGGEPDPICILSLDGGGPGSISQLRILKEYATRLAHDRGINPDSLLLAELFHVIGGVGFGGYVALLLGPLRMPVSQAIDELVILGTTLFPADTETTPTPEQNSLRLKELVQEMLQRQQIPIDIKLNDHRLARSRCKVVVFATPTVDTTRCQLFRTYSPREGFLDCTFVEAACATLSVPTLFAPVSIGPRHREQTFTSASFGFNNPTEELIKEAEKMFGPEARVSTVLSIGSGRPALKALGRQDIDPNELTQQIVVDCERVARDLDTRLFNYGGYLRLNADRGMESTKMTDWTSLGVLEGHTDTYLQVPAVTNAIDSSLRMLQRRVGLLGLGQLNRSIDIKIQAESVPALKPRPSLVQNFIGRGDVLSSMHRNHITDRPSHLRTPAITILLGLGGSGKTQTALKFALEFEKLFPSARVYFLNASSEASLRADLETIIRSLGPEYYPRSFEDALQWLATNINDWLVILDNADDPSFPLFRYLPKCNHGNIVITTRNANHASLSPKNAHHLEGLSMDDAIELIIVASGSDNTEQNRILAYAIAKELGHLPLALAQAAGYIFVHECLSTYLDIYHTSQKELLESVEAELPSDYQASVATTIAMSLNRLSPRAQSMMQLFSHLDSTSIAREVIVKSASRKFREVVRTHESKLQPQTVEHADALIKIFCPSGIWVAYEFNKLITQCLQYSLLRLTTQGDAQFYSMHILVQAYLRMKPDSLQGRRYDSLVVRLLGSSITAGDNYEHIAFNRLLLPHLRLIKMEDVIEAGDHSGFGRVLRETGNGKLSVIHRERCVKMWRMLLGDEDESTLASMAHLAISYKSIGSIQKALEMEESLLVVQKSTLGPDHRDTLLTAGYLAESYRQSGRYEEAVELHKQVLPVLERKLGMDDHSTLVVMGNLAMAYYDVGRYQEALELQEKAFEGRKRTCGPENPRTLRSMGRLAMSYSAVGRHQESLELQVQVLELEKTVLGPEHPQTLVTMGNLANLYTYTGRHQEALDLNQQVVKLQSLTLGPAHPDAMKAMSNLANAYSRMGRNQEALEINRQVLEIQTDVLGPENPHTLHSARSRGIVRSRAESDDESPPAKKVNTGARGGAPRGKGRGKQDNNNGEPSTNKRGNSTRRRGKKSRC